MAKSLRSRSKLAARTAKRRDPKSDYVIAAAARTNAVASRLAARMAGPKPTKEGEDSDEKEVEGEMEVDAGSAGEASDEAPQKISTSGTRESRRETWRAAKGWKAKNGKGALHHGTSKNNGRVKRRR